MIYGGIDIPLSTQGEAEAVAAAKTLVGNGEKVDICWSSPLSRAVYGTERIAEACGVELDAIIKHDGFREVDRGDWVGLSMEEIGAEPWAEWNASPGYRKHNGEALADVAARVLAAKEELLEQSPWGSTTALTSHMWVTRSILADALGYDTKADTSKVSQGGGARLSASKNAVFFNPTNNHRPSPATHLPPPTATVRVARYPDRVHFSRRIPARGRAHGGLHGREARNARGERNRQGRYQLEATEAGLNEEVGARGRGRSWGCGTRVGVHEEGKMRCARCLLVQASDRGPGNVHRKRPNFNSKRHQQGPKGQQGATGVDKGAYHPAAAPSWIRRGPGTKCGSGATRQGVN